MAHHADDQAETVLLHALRGAGVRGLAGIPSRRRIGKGWLIRPLLHLPRSTLRQWLQEAGVQWLEDPSNADTSIPRNYLRNEIMPLLQRRWPAAGARLARTAEFCRETADFLSSVGENRYARLADVSGHALHLGGFSALSSTEKHETLRTWVLHRDLPLPPEAVEHQIIKQLSAREDAQPLVAWAGAEMRRYRDFAYLSEPQRFPASDWTTVWNGDCVDVPDSGRLVVHGGSVPGSFCIRFMRGGEAIRPAKDGPSRTLKNLFQEHGVPPWERRRIPLIYREDTLVAVADFWLDHAFAAELRDAQLSLQFVPHALSDE